MKNISVFLRQYWSQITLSLVLFFLIKNNFTPQTWLIGWDNLLPELNIKLNLYRSLFAVWQDYQGLGTVGGMAYASDLIRQIILLPFIAVLPHHLIRYIWHFSMLILGTFGIYHLSRTHFRFHQTTSLLSALFYLLNWGTVQYFWAPYEAFSTFWGFFPWLIHFLLSYLAHPGRVRLFRLALINLLAAPSFYVPTLFIVYFLCLLLILFSWLISLSGNSKITLTHSAKVILTILAVNSFWFLPFIYFFATSSQNPQTALGNVISSPEIFERNYAFGYPLDFLSLKNYFITYQSPGTLSVFMSPWDTFTHILDYRIISLLIGIFALFGLRFAPIWLRLLFVLSATALLLATPPFSWLNSLLRQFQLLNQVFRNPFTKFLVPTAFTFSLLLAFSLISLHRFLVNSRFYRMTYIPSLVIFLAILNISRPSFAGNFIAPQLRRAIPASYFQMFGYFSTQPPKSRILHLPAGSFWGWTNYNWGPSTSGFIWHGLSQSVLDRNFDIWSSYNEQFYWELDHALQSRDTILFRSLLAKYSIDYVLFDDSIYFPNETVYTRQSIATHQLLNQSPDLSLAQHLDNLFIYQVNPATTISNTPTLPALPTPFTRKTPLLSPPPNLRSPPLATDTTAYNFSSRHHSDFIPVNFPSLSLDRSYVLSLTYRHRTGLPLRLSLFSDSQDHLYLDTQLPNNSDWQTVYFIIPNYNSTSPGLTLLFHNPAFNSRPTVNEVKSISFSPYEPNTILNPPPPARNSPQLITNHQSYHPGWLAISSSLCTGGPMCPTSYHLLNHHTLPDAWANAWKPTPHSPRMDSIYAVPPVVIFFWPQILEFIGLSFIPLCFWLISRQAILPHSHVILSTGHPSLLPSYIHKTRS